MLGPDDVVVKVTCRRCGEPLPVHVQRDPGRETVQVSLCLPCAKQVQETRALHCDRCDRVLLLLRCERDDVERVVGCAHCYMIKEKTDD